MAMPTSISPASIRPAPMAHTAILPASDMSVRPQSAVQGPSWTQIPGAANSATAAPDGSLWVLSNAPAGNDKYIWHYVSGSWTNISGLASQLAVAPNGTLYAINSGGGTYSYSGGTWTALGGGASGITTAADGSFYVLSNGNAAGSDQAIWHNVSGTWSQVPGSGTSIEASWDVSNSYVIPNGTVSAGGLYILNSIGSIYHENADNSFVQLPGNASAIAPTTLGGVYVLGFPSNAAGDSLYYYDLNNPGWSTQSGSGVSISTNSAQLFVIGSSGGIYSTPVALVNPDASACNTTNVNPQSVVREAQAMGGAARDTSTSRRTFATRPQSVAYAPGLLEVTYDNNKLSSTSANLRQAESNAGATSVASEIAFAHIGRTMRVLHVSGDLDAAQSKLRALPAVVNVSRVQLRFRTSAAVNFPNDPYLTHEVSGGNLVGPPFYQLASTGGEWDMHLICVSRAWGYAVASGNTFGATPAVLAAGVKIAIIDTGIDTTHPDLQGKIVYTALFNGGSGAKTGTSITDQDGHGTDVSGIAAADTNNSFGFSGAGYNAQLIGERVFPTPDAQGCPGGDQSPLCSASTADIAAAVTDAVNNGAKVINLSLGGSCLGGDSPDEGQAIANAIADGTVVVAAAGNEGATSLDAPGCDPGVIAVGASALNDGQPNGSSYTGTNPEYMASYSDYDASNPSTWGVSAPGGDAAGGGADNDILHWIENLYTSTSADPNYGPTVVCKNDPFGEVGNCRIEIDGTSMASPHVAGVVALMLGANPNLTPAGVETILCETAVNINDPRQGCGRIDAYRAVARALGDSSVP
jgi:hypothetical protein